MFRFFRRDFFKKKSGGFKRGQYPTQETYEQLLNSVPFHMEKDSAGTEDMHGLAFKASNDQSRKNVVLNRSCNYAVQPYQLPHVRAVEAPGAKRHLMPSFPLQVTKNETEFNEFAVWDMTFTKEFTEYLKDTLVPIGGYTNQVLTKVGNGNFDFEWADPQQGCTRVLNIGATGLDEAYDTFGIHGDGYDPGSKWILGGRRGVLTFLHSDCWFWFLEGNPDPDPYNNDSVAKFRTIKHKGARDGRILRINLSGLTNVAGGNLPNMILCENDIFEGNIKLGRFGAYDGGFKELALYNGDTITLVYHDGDGCWYLIAVDSPQDTVSAALARVRKTSKFTTNWNTFSMNQGDVEPWMSTSFYAHGNVPLPVKIDFSGAIDHETTSSTLLGQARIRLHLDGVLLAERRVQIVGNNSDNIAISWIGDANGNPVSPGHHDIQVDIIHESSAARSYRFFDASITVS